MLKRGFYLLVAGMCAALVCAAAHAQEASSPLRAEQQRIHNAFEAERRAFSEAQQKARTDEERNRLKLPDRDKFTGEMLAATEKNIQDPGAIDALIWILSSGRHGSEPMAGAMALLQKHFIASERMTTVCAALEFDDSEACKALLKELLQKSPHRSVKGAAALTLGQLHAEDDPQQAERYYADAQKQGTPKQAEAARAHLFQMTNLAIGKAAPEIEGEDGDSKKFKLSDYRGKVVLLSFWGDW
jgi:hypothetical protein